MRRPRRSPRPAVSSTPGSSTAPATRARPTSLVEQARKLPDLGAARVLLHDPSGSLQPHRAHELVKAIREQTGLPVGRLLPGRGRERARASALEAVRAGADRIASAVYPGRADAAPRLRRGADRGARRARARLRRRRRRALARVRRGRRAHRRRARDPARAAYRRPSRRAQRSGGARRLARRAAPRAGRRRPDRRGARRARAHPFRDRLAAAGRPDRPDPRLPGARPRALRGAATSWSSTSSARSSPGGTERRPLLSTRASAEPSS